MNILGLKYQAGSFLTAYINLVILNDQSLNIKPSSPIFTIPMIVNGAFAAELSLKAILSSCGINYEKSHNLLYLFTILPEDLALEIVNRSIAAAPIFKHIDEWLKQLMLISDGFEHWRYSYDTGVPIVVNFNFLQAFVQATSNTLTDHFGSVELKETLPNENSEEEFEQCLSESVEKQKQVAIEKFRKILKKGRKK